MAFDSIDLPASLSAQTVESVRHWSDDLFSFRLSRPASFRFRSGEFVMLGLIVDGKPLLRAYSIASAAWDDGLDFYSIKVEDGPLTSRLQNIEPGQRVALGKKPTGTLVLDALKPGRRLFMFSTGTGVAPFASLVREPETYEKFDEIVLTHTCRNVVDLSYGADLVATLKDDPLVGDVAPSRLRYYATTTREASPAQGRITDLIASGRLFDDLDADGFDPARDRAMICGSTAMIADTKALLADSGFEEGANNAPGDYVVEKAFAG